MGLQKNGCVERSMVVSMIAFVKITAGAVGYAYITNTDLAKNKRQTMGEDDLIEGYTSIHTNHYI